MARRSHQGPGPADPRGGRRRSRTERAGARQGHRHRRALPHRQAGRGTARAGHRAHRAHRLGQGREARGGRRATASSARTAARTASSSEILADRPGQPRPHQGRHASARPSRARTSSPSRSRKGAKKYRDGSKPATLYMSNQHAREWITPEMTRRLMHYYLDELRQGPADHQDRGLHRAVVRALRQPRRVRLHLHRHRRAASGARTSTTTTATAKIAPGDGVDLNRNFTYKWGYDNEGSSPDPSDETYRGTGPASEPETRALDAFEKRIGFEYGINYHSAAELLLYGVGWQVATPTPDDVALQVARRYARATPRSPATAPRSPPSSTPPTARPTDTRPTSTA